MLQKIVIIFMGCFLVLSGCQTTKKDVGNVIGGVLGGVIGSQIGSRGSNEKTAAIIAGTLLGAWAGGQLGQRMEEGDVLKARSAELDAYDTDLGNNIDWRNKQTGNYGSVTPIRERRNSYGNQCREFQHNVTIDGREETAYGTACKDRNGKWQIIKGDDIY